MRQQKLSMNLRHCLCLTIGALFLFSGCTEQPKKVANRYPILSPRNVPPYLKGSILEFTDLGGIEPFPVSGYGMVTHLHGTGGTRAPTPVRAYMTKQLDQHDFFSLQNGWASPDQILSSKDVSIVRIDGLIPPGARSGTDWCTWFDVQVSVLPGSDATSLAHGDLFRADLKVNGANPADPASSIVVKAQAAGSVFINPSYLLDAADDTPAARNSRKTGVILAGARVLDDRPLLLRLRSPGARAARAIEQRVIERFQDVVDDDLRPATGNDVVSNKKVADARDEGVVYVYVPKAYKGDWEHFAGVVRHLYMNGADPQFAAVKSRELADAAVKPDAPLSDISYCWEGLGKPALFALLPLMNDPHPDVQFAAARAAAFLGDPGAVPVLLSIASSKGNPFRVTAVSTLAELPGTPKVDRMCRVLLDSDEALVRESAYQLLVKHGDSSVFTRWVKDGTREVFAMDLVQSSGPPLVFGTQQGIPRIAIFGSETQLELPIIFSAMDHRLTISSEPSSPAVTLFYRGTELKKPVTIHTSASLPEIVAELAGDDPDGARGMHFGYADVLAILQTLVDQHRITGSNGKQRSFAAFALQSPGKVVEPLGSRPLIRDGGDRPQSDVPGPNDKPVNDHLLRPGVSGGLSSTDPPRTNVPN